MWIFVKWGDRESNSMRQTIDLINWESEKKKQLQNNSLMVVWFVSKRTTIPHTRHLIPMPNNAIHATQTETSLESIELLNGTQIDIDFIVRLAMRKFIAL